MLNIILGSEENLNAILEQIESSPEESVTLSLSLDSHHIDNLLDLKFLKREIEDSGKKVTFVAEDERSKNVVKKLNKAGRTATTAVEMEEGVDDFGFVTGRDIAENIHKKNMEQKLEEGKQDEENKNMKKTKPKKRKLRLGINLESIKNSLTNGSLLKIVIICIGLAVVFGTILGVYWFYPKATIKLIVSSDSLVKTVDLIASTSAELVDIDKQIIPGVAVTASAQQSATVKASGTKEAGQKATGTVVIYNKTDEDKDFESGTVLYKARVDGDALEYTLNTSISVDAQTVVETSPTEPPEYEYGRISADVTATLFGSEYNLDEDETLTINDHPTDEFIADVSENITGGSQKTVTMITESDIETLLASLKQTLEKQVETALEGKLADDQQLISGATDIFWGTPMFSNIAGEEADDVTCTLSVSASAIVFSQEDLNNAVLFLLADFVPSGYQMTDNPDDLSAEVVRGETGTNDEGAYVTLSTKLRGYVMPTVEESEIRQNVSGRSFRAVEKYLSTIPNIDSYEIKLWPPLPGPLQTMPHVKNRIIVEIERY